MPIRLLTTTRSPISDLRFLNAPLRKRQPEGALLSSTHSYFRKRLPTSSTKGAAAAALVACLVLLGCEQPEQVERPQPTEAELAKRRFEHIVEEIDHRISNRRSRGPSILSGTTVRLTTTVEDELIPPKAEGLAWRGKVIVTTKSNVTIISTPPEEDGSSDTAESNNAGLGESTSDEDELQATLSELAEARDEANRSQTASMQVIDDNKVETYELIYEDENWRLTTPIDEETEMGVIFGAALKSQRAGG